MPGAMSDSDLAIIREAGVPDQPGPEFAGITVDGVVALTERGRRLYRVSMLMHGLSPDPVDVVRDLAGLREIALKITRVRAIRAMDAAEKAANNGQVPVKNREIVEALFHGTVEDFQAATERRLQCEDAGTNVIPVAFGKATKP